MLGGEEVSTFLATFQDCLAKMRLFVQAFDLVGKRILVVPQDLDRGFPERPQELAMPFIVKVTGIKLEPKNRVLWLYTSIPTIAFWSKVDHMKHWCLTNLHLHDSTEESLPVARGGAYEIALL